MLAHRRLSYSTRRVLPFACWSALLLSSACHDPEAQPKEQAQQIETERALESTSSAGNLVTTAVQDYYQTDIVMLPSVVFRSAEAFQLDIQQVDASTREQILELLEPNRDTIRFGTMRGADIRAFILSRMSNNLDLDLQVAGLRFDLRMLGGWPELFVVTRDKGLPLEDDRNYRVAISSFFYNQPFPGYYFGDNLNFSFREEAGDFGSVRVALNHYLDQSTALPPFNEARGLLINRVAGVRGYRSIAQIQGTRHLSPDLGYQVTTRGIITGVGVPSGQDANAWANIPGRALPTELIIQSPEADDDVRSSEALSVFVAPGQGIFRVGQFVEVTGVVHEVKTDGGFSGTSLRDVLEIRILGENQPLPAPVLIGTGGRQIVDAFPSRFIGDLNARDQLQVRETIDFWESLESMRIELVRPRVVGTEGGEDNDARQRSGRVNFIEVAMVPEGLVPEAQGTTDHGGNFYNPYEQDFNSDVVRMVNSPFADFFRPSGTVLEVGDQFGQNLVGILGFNKNTFGDGRLVFYPSEAWSPPRSSHTSLKDRPKTRLESTEDQLTVAAWNVENLGGTDRRAEVERRSRTGEIIREHLKCPDIMVMPEIQDNNGDIPFGGSAADQTLAKLIAAIDCKDANYQPVNVDPVPFADGGEAGGNIRVAMLYNAKRVGFVPKGSPTAKTETFVTSDGSLNQNPGRLSPNNPDLEGTRKPLLAEFSFRGQRVFVIGNHFNSMLGEGSPMGAMQPYRFRTEKDRLTLGKIVRKFVEDLHSRNPDAKVIVAGDFNAYHQALSLNVMQGDLLENMMTFPGLYPRDRWYTSNYGGNSGAIDFIFASQALMRQNPEFEVLHINSNYMLRYSDHDPMIARFRL